MSFTLKTVGEIGAFAVAGAFSVNVASNLASGGQPSIANIIAIVGLSLTAVVLAVLSPVLQKQIDYLWDQWHKRR